ncbi:ferritin-like protein [Streptomyces sp. NPDC057072]|uniref:ferritin-like domain-containing protein n=1 Tax=Streptomyces sp. NPDC057072 TaxID=3346014 RepID=UPI003630F4DC
MTWITRTGLAKPSRILRPPGPRLQAAVEAFPMDGNGGWPTTATAVVLTRVGDPSEKTLNNSPQLNIDETPAKAPITTLESLREHLQWAIELEHATLPPYLCALYSLDPQRNPDAVQAVSGVFVEEMLHLALAANLLNAVGGQPVLDAPHMLPVHPRALPHGDRSMQLSLLPFGPDALEMFLRLEQPALPDAGPEGDDYETIGQFYDAIEQGLRHLCAELGEQKVFSGDPARQVTAGPFGHTSGKLTAVTDLASALAAMQEIVEQGEGTERGAVWDSDQDVFHPERHEVSHYYRFLELKLGRRYQPGDTPQTGPTGEPVVVDPEGIYPMRPNPRLEDHPVGDPIRSVQTQFNQAYCTLLQQLEQTFNGVPQALGASMGTMYMLKGKAQSLLQTLDGDENTAGPTFQYVTPELRS